MMRLHRYTLTRILLIPTLFLTSAGCEGELTGDDFELRPGQNGTFIDKDGNLVDENGNRVDEAGNPIPDKEDGTSSIFGPGGENCEADAQELQLPLRRITLREYRAKCKRPSRH